MPRKLTKQLSLSAVSCDPGQRIKVLTDYGSQVEIDDTLAVRLYFRSGKEMLRMANMYCDEDQLESAFILYYKFITLFVEKLPTHPDYKTSPLEDVADYKRKVKKVFPIAEEIKKKLKQRYVQEEEVYLAEQKRLDAERLLEEEKRRKEREEQERKDAEMAQRIRDEEDAQIRESLEEQYRQLQLEEKEKRRKEEEREKEGNQAVLGLPGGVIAAAGAGGTSILPNVPSELGSIPESPAASASASVQPPPPPSYSQYLSDISNERPSVPDRSLKKNLGDGSDQHVMPSPTPNNHMPTVDRSTKPSIDHHMSLGGFGDTVGGLRSVIVPSSLMDSFLNSAKSNTLKEAETMGILCGKLTLGVFKITHLFIPKQTGGHDSCDMENEEELIFYQDEFNLITLGWIHTHPTQTAFLSSVDLHSHFPWQKMMPEAIAIVCSPKFNESGIFKLTDRGLDVIGSCRQTGFHPHAKDPPLFETCFHVQISETDTVQVVDKRV